MSGGTGIRITVTVSLFLLSFSGAYSQDQAADPVRLMFYNVENLFDISNDTATDDDEFLPSGLRRWNFRRYNEKINALYKTITAAGEWEPPALVGFCEVETGHVVSDLVSGTNLSKYDFGIIHEDSPDRRGIDVCLIYRKNKVKVISYDYILPVDSGEVPFKTRSVLYVKCRIMNDTLHLFLNHWPSRRGGVLAGESQRLRIAEMLIERADSIVLAEGRDTKIIFAGDFNAVPEDEVIGKLSGHYGSGLSMINLSDSLPEGSGTYRYRGTWEMIDQVIVSESVIAGKSGLYAIPGSLKIFNPSFLLQDDPNYPGHSPFSTYRGYKYQGGYSDHLPVILELNLRLNF
jgi:hypothetical protein